jgi:hypothetical protein
VTDLPPAHGSRVVEILTHGSVSTRPRVTHVEAFGAAYPAARNFLIRVFR